MPHLVDNYAKIVDRRGRDLMCHCTLLSLVNISLISVRFTFPRFNFFGNSFEHKFEVETVLQAEVGYLFYL